MWQLLRNFVSFYSDTLAETSPNCCQFTVVQFTITDSAQEVLKLAAI